ncbi:TolC family protein [Herbaspirillum sp. AP02]|uniref:TolC family protein n=1 Tax=unclassified Herbaspirillum TaxID=2624150 RepID=UPI0015D9DA33|nr:MULTISPECIES: TolC family protein [unclassified Herbaspirillum]MBG7620565.1 TolC family protein [Herbaspirillum sp. AP02]NZD68029.1 TolC family protein [Herbaspirillum sp. AP21]
MNRRLLTSLAAGGLLVAAAVASGAVIEQPAPASFEDALRLALSIRDEVAMESLNLVRLQARVEEARGAFFPSLDLSSQLQRVRSYDDFSGLDINGKFNNVSIPIQVKSTTPGYQAGGALELSYRVYSGGARTARVDEARAEKTQAQARHDSTRKKIAQELSAAYWGLQKAQLTMQRADHRLLQARAESEESAVRLQKRLLALVEREAKLLELQKADIEQRGAARALRDAQLRYVLSLGMTPGRQGTAGLPHLSEPPASIGIERIFGELNLIQDSESMTAQGEMDAAKARIGQAQADYRPLVDLVARYSGTGRADSGYGRVYDEFGRERASVGIQLRWNIFDGGQKDQRVVQAVAVYEQARIRLDKIQRDQEIERQNALSKVSEAQEAITVAHAQLALAKTQLRIAEVRHASQAISSTQLGAARLAVSDADIGLAMAEIDHLLAQVVLQLARRNP